MKNNDTSLIIGLSGKMRSGKNEVGKIIEYLTRPKELKNYDYAEFKTLVEYPHHIESKSFARKLKEIVSILIGISVKDLEKQEVKNMTFKELYKKGYISKSFYDSLDDC